LKVAGMQTSVLLAGGFCALLLAAAAPSAAAPAASGAAAELARLGADSTVRRTLALADLGVTAPIVLKGQDNARVLYFPVPAGIALAGATLRLHADYLQPEAADTRLVLSLDNDIVSARALAQERGDAGIELGVDGTARPNGLIQLGLHWTSAALGARCPGAIASGNALRIRPATALSYSYDGAAVRTLGLAWGALPPAPVILVGGQLRQRMAHRARAGASRPPSNRTCRAPCRRSRRPRRWRGAARAARDPGIRRARPAGAARARRPGRSRRPAGARRRRRSARGPAAVGRAAAGGDRRGAASAARAGGKRRPG
jgi:hypothetical protein